MSAAIVALASLLGCSRVREVPRAAAPPSGFDRAAWSADYEALRAHLELSYSHLRWFASPQGGVDVPALARRTRAALDQASGAAAAEAIIDAFVAGFHDGHFSRLPAAEPALPGPAPTVPPVPADASPRSACAALGYARERGVAFSAGFEATAGFELLATGEGEAFRAGIARTADGRRSLGILRIPHFALREYPGECEAVWARRARSTPCAGACAREIKDALTERLLEVLASRARTFRERGVSALVVDAGGNGGGGDLADWMPRALTDRAVRSARLGLARQPASATYFEDELGHVREALRSAPAEPARAALLAAEAEYSRLARLARGGPPCSMSWVWTEQRPWAPFDAAAGCSSLLFGQTFASGARDHLPRGALASPAAERALYWPAVAGPWIGSWTGKVFLVIDGKTASAAEMFSAVMQDNRIAEVIGMRSTGLGCGFMYGQDFTLPRSKLRYRIPNCVRLRADGTDEVAGITPTVLVPIREGESPAQRAARLLEAVGRRLSEEAPRP